MKSKSFKLFCKELDEIVSVKSFSHDEEIIVYDRFKDYLTQVPASYSVRDYKKKLVDCLLVDASSYYTFLDEPVDESLIDEIVGALYTTAIEAYPHFEFEFICNDINNTIAFDQMKTLVSNHIKTFGVEKTQKEFPKITSFSDIVKVSRKLKREVIGQPEACEKTLDAIKLIVSDIDDFSTLFYIGPTGVGKTKLAKLLGQSYSGKFFKVNCGEFASAHDYAKLIGAPPGYVGHSESSLLGEKAGESNAWVILFDEIEKANTKFYDFLLSLLDDGTCTDNMGNILDFSKSIFIFTTNVGVRDNRLGERRVGFGQDSITYEESKDVIMDTLKKTFNPEFLNRVDHFIFFNRLKGTDLEKITRLELKHLPVKRTKALTSYIINNSNHAEYGARNISKFIKNNISIKIADAVLRKQLPLGKAKVYNFKVGNTDLHITNIEEIQDGSQIKETS